MSRPWQHHAVNPRAGGAAASRRRPIGVFTNYADAERAVDRLSDLGFPVERTAIIGHDLQMVEQVTGRLNYGGAALKGAVSGAFPGALIGWIFGLFNLIYYGLAYWFYLTGLRRLPASTAAVSFYLIPLFGVATASAFGERLEPLQWLGAAIVIAAVAAIGLRLATPSAQDAARAAAVMPGG